MVRSKKKGFNWARILPLALLVAGFATFLYFDGASYLSFDTLRLHRQNLQQWVNDWGLFAPLVYGLIYTAVVAFSLPLATLLSVTAGFLFGVWVGSVTVVLGATAGACLLFLAVRFGFGDSFGSDKEGLAKNMRQGSNRNTSQPKFISNWVVLANKMRQGFKRNAFSYLLVLRLVPVFPFAAVNVAAALLNIPFSTYSIATLFGIIPGSVVYILLGNGLDAIFEAGGTPNLSIIFEPEIILPIVGLAGLVLLNVAYQYFTEKKKRKGGVKKAEPAKSS